ncbi:hypothetical protein [Flavobacterium rivuli]|uniref:hypothetical protein n=1 Tax=Flavobacterium rivuli TaxID=498301 RepID=UPI0003719A6A|nr:hypothetical protein [Flavobacterium rivuli]
MNVYTINWNVFADNMLLTSFRKTVNRILIKALIKPVTWLHAVFMAFRQESLYKVRHNSQKVYLEAVLNDSFDPGLRRIRIVNTVFKKAVFFYETPERREVLHYEPEDNKPVYYNEVNEFVGDGVDFSICVPPSLRPASITRETAFITKMRGLTDYYNLYSKNYNILWVQINN